jgi:hypothetical protein
MALLLTFLDCYHGKSLGARAERQRISHRIDEQFAA